MLSTRSMRIGVATWLLAGPGLAQGAPDAVPNPTPAPSGPAVPGEPGASPGSTGLEAGGVEKSGGPPSPPPAAPAGDTDQPAEDVPTRPASRDADADVQPPRAPASVAPAADTLGGHFVLSVGGAIAGPYGMLSSETGQRRALGPGPAGTVELGIGLSRTLLLGAWGQALWLGPGKLCDGKPRDENECSGTSFAGGPMLRFHLVQGVRFDPWLSAGLGVRKTSIEGGRSTSYFGFDVLHLAVGGDWYALRNVALGTFMELDATVYTDRPDLAPTAPEPREETAALALELLAGVRLTLDLPGK